MTVHQARSEAEISRAADVLLQLRIHFSKGQLLAAIEEQRKEGYQLAYVESGGDVLCVAGFVIARKLAWGKHIYVDDLVTSDQRRSSGAGKKMIDWLKAHALELGCKELHLDSGVQRFRAHRFYLREGFEISSHHFSIAKLPEATSP